MVQSCLPTLAASPPAAAWKAFDFATWPASPLTTRVKSSRPRVSGRSSRRGHVRPITTPGSRRCRYQTPVGRAAWLNRDPIQEWGGFNLYGYVANDPIYLIDPLGLSFWGRVGNGFTGAAAGAASGAGTGAAAGALVGAIGGAGVGAGPGAIAGAGAGAAAGAIGGFIGGVLSGPDYNIGQSASAGAINGALAGVTGGAANVGGVAWGAGAGALSGGTAAGLSSDGNLGAIAGGALFGAGMGFGAGAAEEDAIAGLIFPPTAELWGQDIGNYVELAKGPMKHCQ